MSIEDLINDLIDTRSDLMDLAIVSASSPQQQALRVNAGKIIYLLRELMDDMDYEHTLLICDVKPVMADHYKRLYLASACEETSA